MNASTIEAQRAIPFGPIEPSHDGYTCYRTARALQRHPLAVSEGGGAPELREGPGAGLHCPGQAVCVEDEPCPSHSARQAPSVFNGIDLQTLLRTDGERIPPCDYRIMTS